LDLYIALLFLINQFEEALNSSTLFLKAMKGGKSPGSKIAKCVGIIVICNLLTGHPERNDDLISEYRNEDSGLMSDLERLSSSYINADKETFSDARRMIDPYYDNALMKKLVEAFNQNYSKAEVYKKNLEEENNKNNNYNENDNFADRYK